MLPVDFLLIDG